MIAKAVTVVIAGVLLLVACGRPLSDLPERDAEINDAAPTVYRQTDQFPNVSVFCDDFGSLVYTTTRTQSQPVIFTEHPECSG